MAVISYNGTSAPMPLKSVFVQSPNTPTVLSKQSSPVQPLQGAPSSSDHPSLSFSAPIQVIGLVPVFPCCDVGVDAKAVFTIAITNLACTATFHLSFKTCNSCGIFNAGNFTVAPGDSATTIQTNINALLVSSGGFGAFVNKISVLNIVITIFAPAGTGTTVNGCVFTPVFVSGCGQIVSKDSTFSGGVDVGCECDCRQGTYLADSIPNDQNFQIPVFASLTCAESYKNDKNAFIFSYPMGYDAIANADFVLQSFNGTIWSDVETLNFDDLGTPYNNNFFTGGSSDQCENVNYQGYLLDWNLVLLNYGEGIYRFHVAGTFSVLEFNRYCFNSPPFCLKDFDCGHASGTVKFEMEIAGGTYGSVTDQGTTWAFCCSSSKSLSKVDTVPIPWYDSIRFGGFFGREEYELQRDFIKYANGAINKVRDEAIKSFNVHSDFIPMWLQQRFVAYALQADKLYVSDYNLNNSNYNYKHFWVVCDSGYKPDYRNWSRYQMVKDLKFKEGRQLIYRDRCCS